MEAREIPKNPKIPKLTDTTQELLTKLCFREDDNPELVDLIFVFSSPVLCKEIGVIISDLLSRRISNKVFITGGTPPYQDSEIFHKSESELMLEQINQKEFPHVTFYTERSSRNTLENVTEALKILDFTKYRTVLFVFKAHAAGRGYLTLKKFLPTSQILQTTFAVTYPETNSKIGKDNWFLSEFGRQRVWGEFLRIKHYGRRGDIEFEEVKDIIEQIEFLLTRDVT